MPSSPCTWRASTGCSSRGRAAPRATGTSVRPAASSDHERVAHDVVDGGVAADARDRAQVEVGVQRREEQRARVVDAGVDVEDDRDGRRRGCGRGSSPRQTTLSRRLAPAARRRGPARGLGSRDAQPYAVPCRPARRPRPDVARRGVLDGQRDGRPHDGAGAGAAAGRTDRDEREHDDEHRRPDESEREPGDPDARCNDAASGPGVVRRPHRRRPRRRRAGGAAAHGRPRRRRLAHESRPARRAPAPRRRHPPRRLGRGHGRRAHDDEPPRGARLAEGDRGARAAHRRRPGGRRRAAAEGRGLQHHPLGPRPGQGHRRRPRSRRHALGPAAREGRHQRQPRARRRHGAGLARHGQPAHRSVRSAVLERPGAGRHDGAGLHRRHARRRGRDTVKHFPGIGRIVGNTDVTARGITDTRTTADDPYLEPFAAGIEADVDLVMVGSAIYSKLDPGTNAAFSKPIVTDLLRGRLGWKGVVITDDVGAAKAVSAVPVGQRRPASSTPGRHRPQRAAVDDPDDARRPHGQDGR